VERDATMDKRLKLLRVTVVYFVVCLLAFTVIRVLGDRQLSEINFAIPYYMQFIVSAIAVVAYLCSRAALGLLTGRHYASAEGRWRLIRVALARSPLFVLPAMYPVGMAVVLVLAEYTSISFDHL
jgi:hypothetical protein